ncbi:MAG: outer membrane protein assembly factor BamD [Bacteroidales bacterium]|nr:outer membrane protein assembly factor BamD [Bacteroidales bacterium]
MKKTALFILTFFSILLFNSACNEYKKILKSDNIELKYEKAVEYYQQHDYFKAIQLFDELLTYFRGSARAEDIYYYYAYAHYGQGDYVLAAYYFQNFTQTFSRSRYTEEAMFMAAYCEYLDSPVYSLDQSSTMNAIRGMQNFINTFPESSKVAQANELIDKMRSKLQRKSFEIGKLYFSTEDYRSSIAALNAHLKDFPDTGHKEETYFLIFKSYYLYANKSIESKKRERYINAKEAYETFAALFPESSFLREANVFYRNTLNELNN